VGRTLGEDAHLLGLQLGFVFLLDFPLDVFECFHLGLLPFLLVEHLLVHDVQAELVLLVLLNLGDDGALLIEHAELGGLPDLHLHFCVRVHLLRTHAFVRLEVEMLDLAREFEGDGAHFGVLLFDETFLALALASLASAKPLLDRVVGVVFVFYN